MTDYQFRDQDKADRLSREYSETKPRGNGFDPTAAESVTLEDFYAYLPRHTYIYRLTREFWPAGSVNSQIAPIEIPGMDKPISSSSWLDRYKPVMQMTWAPGLPEIILDRLVDAGGWIKRDSVKCYNLYLPPTITLGEADKAAPWIDHIHTVYPGEADHIIDFLAHRVQRPQEKINHALVLGGAPGIGKDTLLEPIKHAVGHWNFREVGPPELTGPFNGYIKSVVLRISEARDLGDMNRYQFYDRLKTLLSAPPDVIRCNEKHIREHEVFNVCGVIITTNYKTNGIYLPADDRRHFVAWSTKTETDFAKGYWNGLWAWYDHGGFEHVAAYLAKLNLSGFDPKASPPKTQAFWEIVDANRAPEEAELADVLDELEWPDAITIRQLAKHADQTFSDWLLFRGNSKRVSYRLEACGYVAIRNGDASDGLWRVGDKRMVVYAKAILSERDRIDAATAMCRKK